MILSMECWAVGGDYHVVTLETPPYRRIYPGQMVAYGEIMLEKLIDDIRGRGEDPTNVVELAVKQFPDSVREPPRDPGPPLDLLIRVVEEHHFEEAPEWEAIR